MMFDQPPQAGGMMQPSAAALMSPPTMNPQALAMLTAMQNQGAQGMPDAGMQAPVASGLSLPAAPPPGAASGAPGGLPPIIQQLMANPQIRARLLALLGGAAGGPGAMPGAMPGAGMGQMQPPQGSMFASAPPPGTFFGR